MQQKIPGRVLTMTANPKEPIEPNQRSAEPVFDGFERLCENGTRATVTYGYRRWCEFDPTNADGQDFYSIRADNDYVIAAVADGVSQSFFGDLAAREVGRGLVTYLWQLRIEPPRTEELEAELRSLQGKVDAAVQAKEIPQSNEYLAEALRKTRDRGSQTVFAAFCLHVRDRRAWLYHVGDVSTRIYHSNDERVHLLSKSGRWSSSGRGDMLLKGTVENDIVGIFLHTDGVSTEFAERTKRPDVSKPDFLEEVEKRASIDDLSFVAVKLSGFRAMPPEGPSAPGATLKPKQKPEDQPEPALEEERSRKEQGARKQLIQGALNQDTSSTRRLDKRQRNRQLTILLVALAMGFILGFLAGGLVGFSVRPQPRTPAKPPPLPKPPSPPSPQVRRGKSLSGPALPGLSVADIPIDQDVFRSKFGAELSPGTDQRPRKPGIITFCVQYQEKSVKTVTVASKQTVPPSVQPETKVPGVACGTLTIAIIPPGTSVPETDVTVRLIMADGRTVEHPLRLKGSQKGLVTSKPFLGYYQIIVSEVAAKP
jgi:serine/threonine protein phosphatase PrpC